jgi:hypothetical protein
VEKKEKWFKEQKRTREMAQYVQRSGKLLMLRRKILSTVAVLYCGGGGGGAWHFLGNGFGFINQFLTGLELLKF